MHRFVEQEIHDFSNFQEEIEQLRMQEKPEKQIDFNQKKQYKKSNYEPKSVTKIEINIADTSE